MTQDEAEIRDAAAEREEKPTEGLDATPPQPGDEDEEERE